MKCRCCGRDSCSCHKIESCPKAGYCIKCCDCDDCYDYRRKIRQNELRGVRGWC